MVSGVLKLIFNLIMMKYVKKILKKQLKNTLFIKHYYQSSRNYNYHHYIIVQFSFIFKSVQ